MKILLNLIISFYLMAPCNALRSRPVVHLYTSTDFYFNAPITHFVYISTVNM